MQLFPVLFATFASPSLRPLRLQSLAFTLCQAKSLTAKDAKKCREGREDGPPIRRRTADRWPPPPRPRTLLRRVCSANSDSPRPLQLSYALFIVVFFLGLTVAGLFVLRSRRLAAESVILTLGYPVTPLAFLLLVAIMLVLVAMRTPRGALLGISVVSAGLPVYEILRRRSPLVPGAEPVA